MSTTIQDLDHAADNNEPLRPLPAGMPRNLAVGTHGTLPAWAGEVDGAWVALVPAGLKSAEDEWYVVVDRIVHGMTYKPTAFAPKFRAPVHATTTTFVPFADEAALPVLLRQLCVPLSVAEPTCAHGCDPETGVTCTPDGDAGPREQAAESDLERARRLA